VASESATQDRVFQIVVIRRGGPHLS